MGQAKVLSVRYFGLNLESHLILSTHDLNMDDHFENLVVKGENAG